MDVTKEFESWTPFEVLNGALLEDVTDPVFYRLRHLAVLDIQISVTTGSLAPEYILVRLPSAIVPLLPDRAQQAPASCGRHGKDIPVERWVTPGTATVDPTQGGQLPHYVRIDCDTGFLQDHQYDIHAQMAIELE